MKKMSAVSSTARAFRDAVTLVALVEDMRRFILDRDFYQARQLLESVKESLHDLEKLTEGKKITSEPAKIVHSLTYRYHRVQKNFSHSERSDLLKDLAKLQGRGESLKRILSMQDAA